MICVSIGRTRHKMMIAEQQALAEKGAELVELRLDWLSRPPDLTRLLKDRPTPCIVTCRRQNERGRWRGSEEGRLALLRTAIVEGVEYVDLEEDVATQIPRYGTTQRIISSHDFEETPENLEEIHARLRRLDPDIVKLVTMANSPSDVVRMLSLVKEAETPTIGFCMGEVGVASRILCGKYGAPFTYASFSDERELAPGQISYEQMKTVYRFDEINGQTQVFGVIGDPIAHSLSPLIHNAAYRDQQLNCVYLPFRVPRHALAGTFEDFQWLDVRGYSVTIPHKEAVVAMADRCDGPVRDIGAANTLFRGGDGTWHAANTDYDAALASLQMGLQSNRASGAQHPGSREATSPPSSSVPDAVSVRDTFRDSSLAGKKVVMLGAGGVARAIGLGLVRAGASLTISSRTHERAIRLAEDLGCQQLKWEHRSTALADILINCTPVGMHPEVDETPFPGNWLREGMLVFDTVYNPEHTLLLKQARERGCRTVSGVEMFVRQAAVQFEYFTGHPASLDQMRETFRRGISAVRY